ncbi:MAG: DUF1841 family protein [Gammaproteobacteria bacterium]|nr:DUF1841 family protein [Gammaproteobacteria bacterium]
MFELDRSRSRQMFFQAWRKHSNNEVLEPMESLIVDVIQLHPEYHALMENPEAALDKDYFPEMGETNPFLHMALHIAIKEQISINQPFGISVHYQRLLKKHRDPHIVEHMIMECLAQMIWEAQRNHTMPDNELYLECIGKLD